MRIHADKIENGPPHTLSVENVQLILDAVPPTWKEGIKEVHLSNSRKWRGWSSAANFRRSDGQLIIYSRIGSTEAALVAVLSELAAISLGLEKGLRRRPKSEQDRLSRMIAPLKDRLLPGIQPMPVERSAISLEGFHEMHFESGQDKPLGEGGSNIRSEFKSET